MQKLHNARSFWPPCPVSTLERIARLQALDYPLERSQITLAQYLLEDAESLGLKTLGVAMLRFRVASSVLVHDINEKAPPVLRWWIWAGRFVGIRIPGITTWSANSWPCRISASRRQGQAMAIVAANIEHGNAEVVEKLLKPDGAA